MWGPGSLEYYTEERSIGVPADSSNPGLLAVGATHYWDTNTITFYSSRGPTNDGRIKPDIVGTACAQTATYDLYDFAIFNNYCWFAGTSQSSPHVAGLAALVQQANPTFSPQQVAQFLKTNAAERGTAGPDNTWGHGFAQLPQPVTTGSGCSEEITADGTVNGTWAAGCQSQVSGRGYARYYSFTTTQQSNVTIDLRSSVDTYLFLRSGDAQSGAFLHENDDYQGSTTRSQISASLPAGSYTIEATTYSPATTGSFTLAVSGLDGTGGGPQPPPTTGTCLDSITADGTVNGTWAAGCQSAESGRGYARYYSFTTTQQSNVTIDLRSSVDTYLFLRSGSAQSGAFLQENDDYQGSTTRSQISASLPAGSYTIEATTYSPATTGSFTLTVSGLDGTGGGPQPPPTTGTCLDSITADGTVNGTWAAGCQSAESGRGYARYYSFTTTQAGAVTISLDSSEDTYLYLRSGDAQSGSFLYENDDHGSLVSTAACASAAGLDSTDSCITIASLPAGSYTIEATTYNPATTGSFTLTVSGLDGTGGGPQPPPTTGTCLDSITADGTVNGTWAAGCQSAESGRGYARYYSFTTTQQSNVTIDLRSSVDTYLFLRSGDAQSGAFLQENDDYQGDITRSQISASLAAGSYTIEATTYSPATTGSFTLTVSGLDGTGGAPSTGCSVGQVLTLGQSCSHSDFTARVESNGDLSLRFTGTSAPPSGLSLTRSGNAWTINGLP